MKPPGVCHCCWCELFRSRIEEFSERFLVRGNTLIVIARAGAEEGKDIESFAREDGSVLHL
jgi:hypothetical protein